MPAFIPLFKNKFRNTEGWYQWCRKKRSNNATFFYNRYNRSLFIDTNNHGRRSSTNITNPAGRKT